MNSSSVNSTKNGGRESIVNAKSGSKGLKGGVNASTINAKDDNPFGFASDHNIAEIKKSKKDLNRSSMLVKPSQGMGLKRSNTLNKEALEEI